MESSNIIVKFATKEMTPALIRLCSDTLKPDNDAIYNEEFLCAQGLSSSVAKGFVVVAIFENNLCGMLRFYPNKRIKQISLYQFAVSKFARGLNVVALMLRFLHEHYNEAIICKCPTSSDFNAYYYKTGWTKVAERDYYYWEWGNNAITN